MAIVEVPGASQTQGGLKGAQLDRSHYYAPVAGIESYVHSGLSDPYGFCEGDGLERVMDATSADFVGQLSARAVTGADAANPGEPFVDFCTRVIRAAIENERRRHG